MTGPKFCNPANTVQVTESADVPTYFLQLVGIDHVTVTVHSQACSPCGALPLDIVMVLDRTGSMTGQKLANAKQGVTSFLDDLDPAIDNVGLVVLPPAASVGARCGSAPTSNYNLTNAAYLVVPLVERLRQLARQSERELVGSDLDAELRPGRRPDGLRQRARRRPGRARRERPAGRAEGDHLPLGRRREHRPGLPAGDLAVPHAAVPHGDPIANASKASKVLIYSIAYDLDVSGAEACKARYRRQRVARDPGQPGDAQIATPGNYFYQPQPTQLVGVFDAITADLAKGTSRING